MLSAVDAVEGYAEVAEAFIRLRDNPGFGGAAELAGAVGMLYVYGVQLRMPDGNAGAQVDEAADGASYGERRAIWSARFPDLGMYWTIQSLAPTGEPPEVLVGDAIDDLADIDGDLERGLTRYRCGRKADAQWEWWFRFSSHTRDHLAGLLKYLNDRAT